jgi:hypothetical protein
MTSAMVLLALYTYSTIWVSILPWLGSLPDTDPSAIVGTVLIIAFIIYDCIFLMYYLRAALTDPGGIPATWTTSPVPDNPTTGAMESDEEDEMVGVVDEKRPLVSDSSGQSTSTPNNAWPYCQKCQLFKPLRTHHCSRCKRCTIKMDHHCKWINNCVGFHNHKYFILTLYWGMLGCVAVLTLAILRTILKPFDLDPDDSDFARDVVNVIFFSISGICIVLQTFSMLGMCIFHTNLIVKGMTHIEFNCCRGRAPGCRYNQGFVQNMKVLFGEPLYLFWLPVYWPPKGLEGDNFQPVFDAQTLLEWEKMKDEELGGIDKLFTGSCQCFIF